MRKFLVAVAAVMMALVPMGFFTGVADAHHREDHPQPCETFPEQSALDSHPLCLDGVFTPPGCAHAAEGKNPNCPDEGNGGNGDACAPAGLITGPANGLNNTVVRPISAELADAVCNILLGIYEESGNRL